MMDFQFYFEAHQQLKQESPNGGIWIIKIKKEDNINKMWESLLLGLIGININAINFR